MKKQLLKYTYKDKKGFVFTMDVAVAIMIVLLVLAVSSFFAVKVSRDPLVNLQLARVGADMVNLIEVNNLLSPPNQLNINNYLDTILPTQYSMNLEGYGNPSCIFEAGSSPPENKIIVGGKKFFSSYGEYCSLRYKIWLN